jgi:non-heme chloroperoxidase
VITLDPRGHGSSGREERGWTLKQTAADVHRLITELDLRDVTLVGWNNVADDWTYAVFLAGLPR